MLDTSKKLNPLKLASHVARVVIGALFIFSGFVKCIDPMGTLLKIEEYIETYGLEVWIPVGIAFSIWLCSTELMMGLMLLFKVRIRFVSVMSLITITFFTILTFLSLTFFPVEDCGCYGEALTLTPTETFLKNLFTLPLSFIIFWRYRKDKMFAFKRLELFLAFLFFSLSLGLGTYCYRHLPIIDLLPFKTGVNLREAKMQEAENLERSYKTTLIYRQKQTGEVREFEITDSTWQDDTLWEWVDTRSESVGDAAEKSFVSDLVLLDAVNEDLTQRILSEQKPVNLIWVRQAIDLDEEIEQHLMTYISKVKADGEIVYFVCAEELNIDAFACEQLFLNQSVMLNMLRAKVGLLRLRDGVIERKATWRDM